MFKNIGRKIKGLAKFLFWVVVIAAVIGGLLTIVQGFSGSHKDAGDVLMAILSGVLIIVVGVLVAWLQNFLLYGYGELIDCSQKMLRILEENNMGSYPSSNVVKQIVEKPVEKPVQEPITPPTQPLNSIVHQEEAPKN